jgi:hypothetical protein
MVFVPYWFIDDRHTPRREPREFLLSAASGIDALSPNSGEEK